MYIQITDNCNMACEHCCVLSSKYLPGTNMSVGTAQTLIDVACEHDFGVTLGGGEPTIHPDFDELLDYSLERAAKYGTHVWFATNGKQTKKAHKLLDKYEKIKNYSPELLDIELSQDYYHEAIHPSVVNRFKRLGTTIYGFNTAIRSSANNGLANAGFAKLNEIADEDNTDCCCPALQFRANGLVRFCGCDDSPVLGTFTDACSARQVAESAIAIYFNFSDTDGCHRNLTTEDRLELNRLLTL
jgi:organic radical activating enzyme